MWNRKEIISKKNAILNRLKNCNDSREEEILLRSLSYYVQMLENSQNIIKLNFSEAVYKKFGNKIKLLDPAFKASLKLNDYNLKNYMDKNYFDFLVNLSENISYSFTFDNLKLIELDNIFPSEADLINMSKEFYNEFLGDEEIAQKANIILDNSNYINRSEKYVNEYSDSSGLTFIDYFNKEVYCSVLKKNTIAEYQSLNHEVMHGVDCYFKFKLPSQSYEGFQEIPTYTIDFLFMDFLDLKGFETQNLRMNKDKYFRSKALNFYKLFKRLIKAKCGIVVVDCKSYKDRLEIVDDSCLNILKEVESFVIAYGLYNQIKKDKNFGIDNLKKLMSTTFPKNKKPDFSFIDLDDDYLLNLSNEINFNSKEKEKRL